MVVVSVVACVLIVCVVGLVVLRVLASGSNAARRFPTEDPGDAVESFLDRGASFAVTAEIATDRTGGESWSTLVAAGSLDRVPLCSGPTLDGQECAVGTAWEVRTPIAALSLRVADVEPGRRITYAGQGLSIPFALRSFAMQYTVDEPPRGSVTVRWTIAGTPRWIGFIPLRWAGAVVRPFLRVALRSILARP